MGRGNEHKQQLGRDGPGRSMVLGSLLVVRDRVKLVRVAAGLATGAQS